jgi:hypothetical protein
LFTRRVNGNLGEILAHALEIARFSAGCLSLNRRFWDHEPVGVPRAAKA